MRILIFTKFFTTDEENNINNQPMATGYSISTAPLYYNMPESFWSSCPNLKLRTPVNLKSSLHIHCSNIQQTDEYSISSKSDTHHPLDSTATDEVLRYDYEILPYYLLCILHRSFQIHHGNTQHAKLAEHRFFDRKSSIMFTNKYSSPT